MYINSKLQNVDIFHASHLETVHIGYVDNVILAPKIVWIKCEHEYVELDMVNIIKNELKHLYYKKIIVWCGMIEECIKIGLNWKEYFNDYKVCIDFCNIDSKKYNMFGNYDDFYNSAGNSILFCAVKHREGSDIPNIDGCIFLDKVEKRSKRLFIQSMGRVLRKDSLNKKKYGLVIDIKAKSTIEIFQWELIYIMLNYNQVQAVKLLDQQEPLWSYQE